MSSRIAITCLLALLAAGCDRQSPAPEQPATPAAVANAAAPADKVDRSHRGEAAPTVAFADPAGRPVRLASFAGRPVLVNLWATWCAPCIAEMPTLNRLAAGDTVRVIAVSQDLKRDGVAPFLAQRQLTALAPYTDDQMALSLGLGANLPTTILYDAAGREVWRVTGALDWTSAEAGALIAEGAPRT